MPPAWWKLREELKRGQTELRLKEVRELREELKRRQQRDSLVMSTGVPKTIALQPLNIWRAWELRLASFLDFEDLEIAFDRQCRQHLSHHDLVDVAHERMGRSLAAHLDDCHLQAYISCRLPTDVRRINTCPLPTVARSLRSGSHK